MPAKITMGIHIASGTSRVATSEAATRGTPQNTTTAARIRTASVRRLANTATSTAHQRPARARAR